MERFDTCQIIGDKRVRPKLPAAVERVATFAEAEPTLDLEAAKAEAQRCTVSSPCHYCEVCQLMCPDLCILRDEETNALVFDLNYCKGCGLCANYCPHGAIEMVLDE